MMRYNEFMNTLKEVGKDITEKEMYELVGEIMFCLYLYDNGDFFQKVKEYTNPDAISTRVLAKIIVMTSAEDDIPHNILCPSVNLIIETFGSERANFELLESVIYECYKQDHKELVNRIHSVYATLLVQDYSNFNKLAIEHPESLSLFISTLSLNELLLILKREMNDMNNDLLKLFIKELNNHINIFAKTTANYVIASNVHIFGNERVIKLLKQINMEKKLSKNRNN